MQTKSHFVCSDASLELRALNYRSSGFDRSKCVFRNIFQFSLRIRLSRRPGFEELLFAVNQGVDVGRCEFDVVTVRNCIGWTSLYAIATKNTSRIIDIINLGIAIAGRNAIRVSVFCRFDVNTVCRTSRGAEKATHAFLQTVLITLQHVNSAITWLNARGDIRIRFRRRLTEHRAQRDAEPLIQSNKCFTDFFHDRWHRIDFNRVAKDRQFSAP